MVAKCGDLQSSCLLFCVLCYANIVVMSILYMIYYLALLGNGLVKFIVHSVPIAC